MSGTEQMVNACIASSITPEKLRSVSGWPAETCARLFAGKGPIPTPICGEAEAIAKTIGVEKNTIWKWVAEDRNK